MTLISTSALTKHYGKVPALESLDLEIEGGIIGLVGANGAGKSTFIKILLGLVRPSSGSVSVLGFDPERQGEELRQYLGYLPEHDCLPPDHTATDFVSAMARVSGLPAHAARERTAETLRHVGLYEERYRPIGGYSAGMRQRVKLAQALVHDPKLLLLDEPTNGLDPGRRNEMLELIARTGREFGISVIVASHLLAEIEQVCDFLVVIDGGRLRSAAPLADFTKESGVLAVEVDEGARQLTDALTAAGLEAVQVDDREVNVVIGSAGVYDAVRDNIVALELSLTRMEQRRGRVEDIFAETAAAATIASEVI